MVPGTCHGCHDPAGLRWGLGALGTDGRGIGPSVARRWPVKVCMAPNAFGGVASASVPRTWIGGKPPQPFPLKVGSLVRRRVMHRRLLHIVCMALNFLHADFVPIPAASLVAPATAVQQSLFLQIGKSLKVFGASATEFPLIGAGRRTAFLSSSPSLSGDAYADLSGTAVPVRNDADPAGALQPTGCLQAEDQRQREVGPLSFPLG